MEAPSLKVVLPLEEESHRHTGSISPNKEEIEECEYSYDCQDL